MQRNRLKTVTSVNVAIPPVKQNSQVESGCRKQHEYGTAAEWYPAMDLREAWTGRLLRPAARVTLRECNADKVQGARKPDRPHGSRPRFDRGQARDSGRLANR